MARLDSLLLLPATLLMLVAQVSAEQCQPTAIRKIAPDSGEKILAEYLAFAPILPLLSPDGVATAPNFIGESQHDQTSESTRTTKRFYPAFALHHDGTETNIFRKAAEGLALLSRRGACPAGMSSCDSIGAPNKCCREGLSCTNVQNSENGNIACCPKGSSCGGGVGKCPSDAVTCPAELGGGCCIPGYVCQGVGCIPIASTTSATATRTMVRTTTHDAPPHTITTILTTVVEGNPSTVIVTMTVTKNASQPPKTKTTTRIVTATGTDTGVAPWRPTGTSESEGDQQSSIDTQTGCPTGFYGCLATHGGGCCRTDRDCHTQSCPPPESTTIVSNGRTIVVAATDVPAKPTETCAKGWFLCGKDAGPVAGCCPSGYQCGTVSCSTSGPSQTGRVQKQLPGESAAPSTSSSLLWNIMTTFLIIYSVFP